MTSKEAFESLRQEYFLENGEQIIVFKGDDERLNIIEKDLELLALLRKKIVIEVNYNLEMAAISSKKKTASIFNECDLFDLNSKTLKTLERFKKRGVK